ncbi:glycosyltransferase [Paenibacillus arenosi]|uniref:Glycosyltransferase n=1 Tax=Paenibacillus arenosi TaxID=2774142 RepID=A0ABR9AYN1_9BACL|nr:glycosyltransferase [Paenibacillus arenosi]MBD8499122.1 glycosyltransferase [Paenibacillus arenosi]
MKEPNGIRLNKKRLTIVQVISNLPNAHPVPSNKGGTEKIVYELTEELVRRGHDVYLFAAQGSKSSAKLIQYPKSLKKSSIGAFVLSKLPKHTDIIHDHTFHSALGTNRRVPTVCTIHMPVKNKVDYPVYVSKRARKVNGKNRGFYVYNGINADEYEFSPDKHGYLLFMGRVIKSKGVLKAIEVAEKTGKRLIIAGPVNSQLFFKQEIKPRIARNPNIHYVGAVQGRQKQNLLKHAECVLFPTLMEEAFGLVMIEALACGTPVLALNNGSVSEVLAGFPSFVCKTVGEMIRKVQLKKYPSSRVLRRYVVKWFTNAKMTENYLDIYSKVIRLHSNKKLRKPLENEPVSPSFTYQS